MEPKTGFLLTLLLSIIMICLMVFGLIDKGCNPDKVCVIILVVTALIWCYKATR